MARILPLVRKEFRFYLNTPVAWALIIFYLAFTAVFFFRVSNFMAKNSASMRDYFDILPHVFAFIIPALTMRSWAEERKSGTDELLMTMPFAPWQLVLAKFTGPFLLISLMLLLSLPLPLSLLSLGNFDPGVLVCQYLGALLLAAMEVAAGVFFSALSRNQVMAFLASLSFLLVLTWSDTLTRFGSMPPLVDGLVSVLSLTFRNDAFSKGLLDTRDLIFYLGTTGLFLFLNERRLVLAKWSTP